MSRPPSRREALVLLAASAAAACGRPPPGEALPYVVHPDGLVPGVPRAYASSYLEDGLAEGIVVTSREGRPTKIDGNPEHPASLGGTRARTQAWVLGLYDADRARVLREGPLPRAPGALARLLAGPLDGLHVLSEPTSSPLVGRLVDAVRARHPDAHIHAWAPAGPENALAGAASAYGGPTWARPDLAAARVVLTVGADLLDDHPYALRHARDWASRRAPTLGGRAAMSRVYAVETAVSVTGAAADVRIPLPPSALPAFVCALATRILGDGPWSAWRLPADAARLAEVAAVDLLAARGEVALAAGLGLPAWVHALLHAVGEAVGARSTLTPSPWALPPTGLGPLLAALEAGAVGTLVILEGNPAYTSPSLARLLPRARQIVRLGLHDDETSALAGWHVPALHPLEAWGDARAADGTLSFVQPLIRPLWGGWTSADLLAMLAGVPGDGRALLADAWRAMDPAGFDTWFPEAIRLGLRPGTAFSPLALYVDRAAVAASVPPPPAPGAGLELAVRRCPRVLDGRYANNPWLQELPDPITQLAWGNAACLGPETARTLGLVSPGRVLLDGIELPALVVPGHAEGAVSVTLGYGRARGGAFAEGVGVDVTPLLEPTGPPELLVLPGAPELAIAQREWDREGRDVARGGALAAFLADPRAVVGAPPEETPLFALLPRPTHLTAAQQWGMAIDLNACIGCGACALACQAENNVPVVGPVDVAKGRRMHWLRIDRYVGKGGYAFEPMMCQHCEDAPCEYVCPTAATVHSPDGLNEQIYNRCIGTRFCSNNCPWKVRRFNWFDYDGRRTAVQELQLNPEVSARQRGVMEKCTFCVQRIRIRGIDERTGVDDTPEPLQTACQQACPTQAITFGDLELEDSEVAARRADPRSYAELGELGTGPRVRYLARLTNATDA